MFFVNITSRECTWKIEDPIFVVHRYDNLDKKYQSEKVVAFSIKSLK